MKNMHSIIISDTHCHAYAHSEVDTNGNNERLMDIIQSMDAALHDAKKLGCPIIHAGDLFHDRKSIKPDVLHHVGAWFSRAADAKVPVHLLVGNHDLSLTGNGSNSTNIVKANAHVYDTARVADINGKCVGFIPYTTDPQRVKAQAQALKKKGATVLVAHLGIGDPKFSSCVPTDYEAPGCINVSDLLPDSFEQVLLGHYHGAQQIGDNVRYVGSPLQLSYGEAGQDKGWLSWDGKHDPEMRYNVNAPRFHKVVPGEEIPLVRARDNVWVVSDNEEKAKEAREKLGKRGAVVRIEIAAPDEVSHTRIDTSSQEALCTSYLRSTIPNMDLTAAQRRISVGVSLLTENQ